MEQNLPKETRNGFDMRESRVTPGRRYIDLIQTWSVRQRGVNLCHGRLRVQNDFGMTQLMPRLNSGEEQQRTLSSRNCTLIM